MTESPLDSPFSLSPSLDVTRGELPCPGNAPNNARAVAENLAAPDAPADGAPDGTRRALLLMGALGAAALALPALPARAANLGLSSQLKFLQSAQFLQYQFFSRALMADSVEMTSTKETATIVTIANEDGEQARWFRAVRQRDGLMPNRFNAASSIKDPTFTIGAGNYASRQQFFKSAIALKSAVVGAYHGIVGEGGNPDTVQAIAALAGVQNRHLALLKEMAGEDPFVTYVAAMSLQEAGNALNKYGFGTEVNR